MYVIRTVALTVVRHCVAGKAKREHSSEELGDEGGEIRAWLKA